MTVNWVDDTISAVISTLLAIGVSYAISRYFYNKENRDAANNDILNPISKLTLVDDIVSTVTQCKNLYSYRYLKSEERAAVESLLTAAKEYRAHLYDKTFSDAILNYFYHYCGELRYHPQYIMEIGEYIEEPNYDENSLHLERYAGYFDCDGHFDICSKDEIKR